MVHGMLRLHRGGVADWESQCMGDPVQGSAGFCSERVVVCGTCNAWRLHVRFLLCALNGLYFVKKNDRTRQQQTIGTKLRQYAK